MERRRSIAISDDDSRDDESRVNTNNISSSTSAEAVIRYLDYRSQASERKKELDTLRERCIANSRGTREYDEAVQMSLVPCELSLWIFIISLRVTKLCVCLSLLFVCSFFSIAVVLGVSPKGFRIDGR